MSTIETARFDSDTLLFSARGPELKRKHFYKHVPLLVSIVLMWASLPAFGAAEAGEREADDLGLVTDGTIHAFAHHGNTLFIGGQFTRIAKATGAIMVFNKTTGSVIEGFPFINGPVNIAIPDGTGGFYVGGKFSRV